MEFGGHYLIAAPRDDVWRALNDTEILKQTIPGCKRIEWVGAERLELEISVNLGVARPTFSGELELLDVLPALGYTLSGRGKGGLLGLAHGSADVTLADRGENCLLAFTATGGGSGRLMQLGKAALGKSAQHIIDRFFERFADAMGVGVTPLHDKQAE